MALRPIDNALPTTTPERPKKQVKISVPIQKLTDSALNDENKAPVPDVTIDYVSSENLKSLPDPESTFQSLIEGLDSKDWTKVCESLNDARRFALYHSSLLVPILEKVMVVVVKSMKNPRSALCKTSIMASSDIFKAFGDQLLDSNFNALDSLLLQLLLKASQDKKFVCEEADRTLKVMVDSITPLPLLHKLKANVSHNNMRIRAKAAISISNCVSKMGIEGMKEFGLASLVQMAAELLKDKLPEAREAARSIVISIYNAFTKDEDQKQEDAFTEEEDQKQEGAFTEEEDQKQDAWQSFCQSNLPAIDAQSMIKITTTSR